ncbi:MAG: EamA family transporter, partial [Gaiellaceae bacterium]
MVAERRLESAFAGVVVASVPLWIVLLRLANRERVARRTVVGVALGLAGVVLLLSPSGARHPSLLAVVPMLCATLSWSVGSYYAKRLTLPADPFVATAWEMTLGGALLLVLSVPFGEPWQLHPERISGASFAGWAYLVTVGSIVPFSAYVWLLRNAPISIVVTHQFVNPVVAVVLGALILGEHLGGLALVGTTIVIGSVAFVLADGSATRRRESASPSLAGSPARK